MSSLLSLSRQAESAGIHILDQQNTLPGQSRICDSEEPKGSWDVRQYRPAQRYLKFDGEVTSFDFHPPLLLSNLSTPLLPGLRRLD